MRDRLGRTFRFLLAGLVELTRDDWLLAAVSGRRSLAIRVKHILDGPRTGPNSGRLWTAIAAMVATLCVVGLALTQGRPENSPRERNGETQDTAKSRVAQLAVRRTIRGTVTWRAGEPVAKATV